MKRIDQGDYFESFIWKDTESSVKRKKKKKGRNASLYQCIFHYQAKQIFKYCMETCSDGEPEIYLVRKGDR